MVVGSDLIYTSEFLSCVHISTLSSENILDASFLDGINDPAEKSEMGTMDNQCKLMSYCELALSGIKI